MEFPREVAAPEQRRIKTLLVRCNVGYLVVLSSAKYCYFLISNEFSSLNEYPEKIAIINQKVAHEAYI